MLNRVKGWLFEDKEDEQIATAEAQPIPRKRKSSLLSLHNPRAEEIFIRRPRARDDAPICADDLRGRCPVIMNLKSLDSESALRVFDFMAGVVYAIDGQMESVGDGIFLLTPREVEISTEFEDHSPSEPDELAFWQEQQ
jgi:cell division inhibitor SepF